MAVRRLTPRECERLQSFPDNWTLYRADGTEQSDSARYRQLGNAVCVAVAEWILKRLATVDAAIYHPRAARYKTVSVDGHTYTEHKLVWERANGPVPDGYVVHHRNHNKRDNRLENLELLTHEEHSRHHNDKHPRIKQCVICGENFEPPATKRARQQTCSRDCYLKLAAQATGSQKGGAKLTEATAREIHQRLAQGELGKDLAAEYHVSPMTISRIRNGESYGLSVVDAALPESSGAR